MAIVEYKKIIFTTIYVSVITTKNADCRNVGNTKFLQNSPGCDSIQTTYF